MNTFVNISSYIVMDIIKINNLLTYLFVIKPTFLFNYIWFCYALNILYSCYDVF